MRSKHESGFTLIELMLVIAIIGILEAIAIPSFKPAPDKAREAVLKTDLHTMREALDQYFADKSHYPDSLESLVEEGYLRSVPVDPFTKSNSTWRLIYANESGNQEDLLPEEQAAAAPGIFDIKSGASRRALDGSDVADW